MRNKQNSSVVYSLHAKMTFNLNVVGKKGSGKSSLVVREIKDTFGTIPGFSQGFEFYSKTVSKKSEEISVQIWDTVVFYSIQAGTCEYNSMTRNFFRKAAAIILVYDKIDNLQQQISILKHEINEYAHEGAKLCIVRTKIDLNPITQPEKVKVKDLCEKKFSGEIFYCGQVSAKTNQNVHKFFSQLIDEMFKCYEEDENFREAVTPSKDSFFLNSVDPNNCSSVKKKKRCC